MLLALICVPLAAAILACFVHGREAGAEGGDAATRFGLVLSLAIAALAVLPVAGCAAAPVDWAWFQLWGTGAEVRVSLAADGLSAWLILLVAALTPVAVLAGRGVAGGRMREWLVAVFAAEALMIGALLARDTVLFYLCYEGMLVPVLVLLALFGGFDRRAAALWFLLPTMAGSVLMLVAIWFLAAQLGTTAIDATVSQLRAFAALPAAEQPLWWVRGAPWLFGAFALAFAVKVPLVPLHFWQARTYAEMPAGAAVLLAGAMAKIGVYGFLRLVLPLFPEQCAQHQDLFLACGAIGAVGGAVVALAQDDAKRLLAYSSLSHLGLVMVGIFTFQPAALSGVAVQMVAHGLSTAAMFVLVGAIEERTRSPYLDDHGGLAGKAPLFAVLFVISALCSAGIPGSANFAGEFLLLLGIFRSSPWLAAAVGLSVILGAAYLLILVQRWCYGEAKSGRPETTDLVPREAAAVIPLLAASILLGLFPSVIAQSAGADCDRLAAEARRCASAPPPAATMMTARLP